VPHRSQSTRWARRDKARRRSSIVASPLER
jgi:hypothetical protein